MRKLKLQVQITVDGFISGKNAEMDWMQLNWSEDIIFCVKELTASIDTILLGRNLAEGFIPHWKQVASNSNDPEQEAGIFFSNTTKFVFSNTLKQSAWENTLIVNGNLTEEINKLKAADGKDIMVYGGGKFVSSLIQAGLIDEFYLFVNPAAIGNGMTIFKDLDGRMDLKLKKTTAFDCGIVLLQYALLKK